MASDDESLFQKAMQHVKPLKPSPKQHVKKPRAELRVRKPQPQPKLTQDFTPASTYGFSSPWDTENIQPETCLSYGKHKLQYKQFLALKQGKRAIDARLDLHGFNLEQANTRLTLFIHNTYQHNKRTLLIIHGKGGHQGAPSALKSHVNHWLKELPEVLAFHSARPHHGGTGALYVLLAKHQTEVR